MQDETKISMQKALVAHDLNGTDVNVIIGALEPLLDAAADELKRTICIEALKSVNLSIDAMVDVYRRNGQTFGMSPSLIEAQIAGMTMVKEAMEQTMVRLEKGAKDGHNDVTDHR